MIVFHSGGTMDRFSGVPYFDGQRWRCPMCNGLTTGRMGTCLTCGATPIEQGGGLADGAPAKAPVARTKRAERVVAPAARAVTVVCQCGFPIYRNAETGGWAHKSRLMESDHEAVAA